MAGGDGGVVLPEAVEAPRLVATFVSLVQCQTLRRRRKVLSLVRVKKTVTTRIVVCPSVDNHGKQAQSPLTLASTLAATARWVEP